MTDIPTLTTERLRLTAPRWTDVPTIVEYAGDERIAATTLNIPHPYAEQHAVWWINLAWQSWENGSKTIFGLRLRDTDEFIGGMGLHLEPDHRRAELGYWIAVPFWGKGYATEAAAAVLRYGFTERELHRIQATHLQHNPASGRVMEKNGMRHEATLRDYVFKNGEPQTLEQRYILRADFAP